jgi:VWFA-related protein
VLLAIRTNPIGGSVESDCRYISHHQADLIINKHDSLALQAAVRDFIACKEIPAGTETQASTAIAAAQPIMESLAMRELAADNRQSKLALDAVQRAVDSLARMPGHRTLVIVSPGFLLVEDLRAESETVQRSPAANVTINSLDARGLYTMDVAGEISRKRNAAGASLVYENQLATESARFQSEILNELAEATGGVAFRNNNDLEDGFKRTAAVPEYWYVPGFSPQDLKYNGKYHSLKVKLRNNSGYTLKARKGYYAPNRAQSVVERAKSDIDDAVFSQEERSEVPLELGTQFFKINEATAKLTVIARIDVRSLHYDKVGGRNSTDLVVVSALFDANGNLIEGDQKTVQMRLTDDTLQNRLNRGVTVRAMFDIKSGKYQIRCVLRDNEGRLSAKNRIVDIP